MKETGNPAHRLGALAHEKVPLGCTVLWLGMLGAAVLVALGACASDDEEPTEAEPSAQTFTITAGEADESVGDVGLFAFYPSSIATHPGDTIRFENGSGQIPVPHTLTLGSPAEIGQSLPPPVVPEVGQVPSVWALCVSEEPIAATTTDCPEGPEQTFPSEESSIAMPSFSGQSYYNSGIFDPGQTLDVSIGSDVEPGTYDFFCYLHPATMTLSVEVVAPDESTQTQADLDEAAESQRETDLADGMEALDSGEQANRGPDLVQAGAEEGAAVVMSFFPKEITVKQGSTVMWENKGNDPHVVSMERGVGPHDPQNFAPPSVEPSSDYSGGFVISGVFGAPFPSQSFALRFVKSGEYNYVCPIHPGMAGAVRVVR